jgi:hypothetical protein
MSELLRFGKLRKFLVAEIFWCDALGIDHHVIAGKSGLCGLVNC